ncbi:MAG: zinc ABC transporter substrate-binding protein [Acholeplasmatales bacterium]|jgi:zinc transport system substrate-binding protein|nr:zinc ABC transporter substrate-binding protein [Acholeplasmataceae bacterium]MCK9289491.1 zinc ABC transporter substrate-binding protein [Acholeplasmataceae bacterium]MCK9427116.1 zinc ABC transporter substrate-binding protein [Acholeplasmataceae bacterium]MDY0114944.1 zinc ABC transporter substrate-binding protein [Acholeplasmatales bacterium]
MKKVIIFISLALMVILTSCGKKKYDIVTTLYPQYEIAQEIVLNKLSVKPLIVPGADAHHFEPTSKNMIEIIDSSLFIYSSLSMEPWVEKIEKGKGHYLNLYEQLTLIDSEISDDVHFFFSLDYQIEMINLILAEIIIIDPLNEEFYQNNATQLEQELRAIKNDFINLEHHSFYFIGHDVFASFSQQTNITIISLLNEFTDETNPTSNEIETMYTLIKTNKVKFLYYDSLTGYEMAKRFQNDLKNSHALTLLPLHTFHNVDNETFKRQDLIALWRENYQNLERGINNGA